MSDTLWPSHFVIAEDCERLAAHARRAAGEEGWTAERPRFIEPSRPRGTFLPCGSFVCATGRHKPERSRPMHGLIYLVGLIVVILAILSFFGLR
jgi:hypothetical protein